MRQKAVTLKVNRTAYYVKAYNTEEKREEKYTLLKGEHLPEHYVEISREPAGRCRTTYRMNPEEFMKLCDDVDVDLSTNKGG